MLACWCMTLFFGFSFNGGKVQMVRRTAAIVLPEGKDRYG